MLSGSVFQLEGPACIVSILRLFCRRNIVGVQTEACLSGMIDSRPVPIATGLRRRRESFRCGDGGAIAEACQIHGQPFSFPSSAPDTRPGTQPWSCLEGRRGETKARINRRRRRGEGVTKETAVRVRAN